MNCLRFAFFPLAFLRSLTQGYREVTELHRVNNLSARNMSRAVKTLEIPQLDLDPVGASIDEISEKLDKLNVRIPIDEINWEEFDYLPDVRFSMAYTEKAILLKYYVNEKYFTAEKTETNQNVYEDSCVEFFVSPDDDGIYYNLEFNAIGTCLMGSGSERAGRQRGNPSLISEIRRKTKPLNNIRQSADGLYSWELTLAVPLKVLFRHSIGRLRGKTFRANFFKCGDKLEIPHYVTWNPVNTPKPDFHRPEFFGNLKFV